MRFGGCIFGGANLSRRIFHTTSSTRIARFAIAMASQESTRQCTTADNHEPSSTSVVPKEEVVRFISECLKKAGTSEEDALTVAHHLMTADYRGHFSHGMNRMQMYVQDIEKRITDPAARPEVVTDFQAIALVDGKNALGQVVGKECMKMAMEKAKKFGIGMISARGSNHYGICGYYASMAMDEDLIGFTCTNTSPLMAPTRSKKAALGTNPLSLGMAAAGQDSFLLDMATTSVALGKIELAIRKNEAIPPGWALGRDGEVTTDAQEAYDASLLMPLGGPEKNSGYKGYGLALMVEVLCGVLSGSQFGPNIRQWKAEGQGAANLGHCFMAIDPRVFTNDSKERLATLLRQLRDLPTAGDQQQQQQQQPVLVAGDLERRAMARVDENGGIAYHPNQLKASKEFAQRMNVRPMKLIVQPTNEQ